MSQSNAIQLTLEAIWLMFMLSGPAIIVAAAVGLIVSLVQAVTQVQEQTIQFAAKFVAIVITIFVTATFLAGSLVTFADRMFGEFPSIIRR